MTLYSPVMLLSNRQLKLVESTPYQELSYVVWHSPLQYTLWTFDVAVGKKEMRVRHTDGVSEA